MSNWNWSGPTSPGFPAAVVAQARRTLPMECAHCGDDGGRLELDHIHNHASGGGDTIDNAQWLCHACHAAKTKREAAIGRARRVARGRHPVERHPGLI